MPLKREDEAKGRYVESNKKWFKFWEKKKKKKSYDLIENHLLKSPNQFSCLSN